MTKDGTDLRSRVELPGKGVRAERPAEEQDVGLGLVDLVVVPAAALRDLHDVGYHRECFHGPSFQNFPRFLPEKMLKNEYYSTLVVSCRNRL